MDIDQKRKLSLNIAVCCPLSLKIVVCRIFSLNIIKQLLSKRGFTIKSHERVERALKFRDPDRIPILKAGLKTDLLPLIMLPSKNWHPGHEEGQEGIFPHLADDIMVKLKLYRWKKPEWTKQDKYKNWLEIPRVEIDEWGCFWNRSGGNVTMGHPGKASLTDYSNMDDYLEKNTPDPDEKERYKLFTFLAKTFGRNKYRLGQLGHVGPSQTASMILGFNKYLIDHRKRDNKPHLKKLLAHLTDFYVKCIHGWKRSGAKPHGIMLVDDLGEQSGPFFSPKIFKEFYEPVYKTIFTEAHNNGLTTYLHCCGKVDKLLPDLIEWGLDMIEFDSPRMSGYDDLRPFRGKIMFWGCVNIQSIYTKHPPRDVELEVWHMMRNLGTEHGGFGAYYYAQPYHLHVPKENIKAFTRGIKRFGTYSKIPKHWWSYPTIDNWDNDIMPELPPLKE